MQASLAIPVQEMPFKDGPLETSPTHLPYPSPEDKQWELAIPVKEAVFRDDPFDGTPRVKPYPLTGGQEQPNALPPIPEMWNRNLAHDTGSMFMPYAPGSGPPDTTSVPINSTRFNADAWDPPSSAPPYASMLDKVMTQGAIFKCEDSLRQDALFPVRLKAGQHSPVNGELGRNALPTGERLSVLGAELGAHPRTWCIPEAGDNAIVAVSV